MIYRQLPCSFLKAMCKLVFWSVRVRRYRHQDVLNYCRTRGFVVASWMSWMCMLVCFDGLGAFEGAYTDPAGGDSTGTSPRSKLYPMSRAALSSLRAKYGAVHAAPHLSCHPVAIGQLVTLCQLATACQLTAGPVIRMSDGAA